jgi:6-phosphogluconolactonase
MIGAAMILPRPRSEPEDYGLEPEPVAGPALPGEVIVAEDADRLLDLLAAELVVAARAAVRRLGDFQLALSGGRTPQPLYERLMYDADFRQLPWIRTHLWLVDERVVPPGDERSNYSMIRETIVEHSGIPPEQVHPMPVDSETGDEDYERTLREVLQWRPPGEDRLDFVLLGMGADGHTASLFPFTGVLEERRRLVCRVTVPPERGVDPPQRLTMTYPILNASRLIAVLVTGADKAQTIRRVAGGQESTLALPIRGIMPVGGQLKWFLDRAACGSEG